MDTIRLKFRRPLPANSPYFSEKISKKELLLEHVSGNRYAWTNNTWRKEMQQRGFYMPKYWIEEDFIDKNITYFYIEASLPKLLFKNNLRGLHDCDLDKCIKAIVTFTEEIGIHISSNEVRTAKPTLLAIGKNIPMTGICSCTLALRVLGSFDYKQHAEYRVVSFNDYKGEGKELHFNIKNTETTKFYDKKREIINNAQTADEKVLADKFKCPECVVEILRVERTFKTKRKIAEKFRPYLENKEPIFESLFKEKIWDDLLKDEVDKILNHSFANFIFLSLEHKPLIEAVLGKHFSHIQTRNNIKELIADLQELGLAETRKKYLKGFKSRQSWYNYSLRLKFLSKYIDYNSLSTLDSFSIHKYILKQFGIDNSYQSDLGLDFTMGMSKKIDTQPRNTGGGRYD